ncbi:MAG: hypothetical protein NVS4B1_33550 [Ktedonobacteraceae bacterium]
MNISTGGPHILFFERDQQLTALLTSEFQLAGYECHVARTAVEVFDTIARFPVRILLVNLAQAAAGRREFWVALDTQRRGRGVQVFTYLCSNLAGYGPRDTDEHSQSQLADIEIDGMLGLMNLVDAVRARVPGPTSTSPTSAQARLTRVAPSATPPTAPSSTNTRGTIYQTGPIADTPRTAILTASVATQVPPPVQQSYSEKIRAVLYPTQRSTNALSPAVRTDTIHVTPPQAERPAAYTDETQQNVPQNEQRVQNGQTYDLDATALQRLAYGQTKGEQESGLDQLSRLLQEHSAPPMKNESTNSVTYQAANEVSEHRYTPPTMPTTQYVPPMNYAPATQAAQSTDTIGTQPLRASPIEDLPLDRATSATIASDGTRRADGTTRTNYGYTGQIPNTQTAQTTPLASITTLRTATAPTPAVAKTTIPMPIVIPPQPAQKATIQEQEEPPIPIQVQEEPTVQQEIQETQVAHSGELATDEEVRIDTLPETASQFEVKEEEGDREDTHPTSPKEQDTPVAGISPNNAMLLDIVQSLPLMPSPQTQAVSGRTMRTLGSVLLEGHLVPQSRLEVAQNIQRMLRGVDLNYQLGEILLMFKLLTPDQLLAASLVSYGMISTQQISALGRIRQELHALGLEYDLESLLILFRMLTPEQLREVRTSWQG